MRATSIASALLLGAALVACGGGSLKAAGEECVASSECAPGLLCDFGSSPRVCAPTSTDASPGRPDAAPTDAGVDAPPVVPPIDAAVMIDAPPMIDAAPPADAPPDAM